MIGLKQNCRIKTTVNKHDDLRLRSEFSRGHKQTEHITVAAQELRSCFHLDPADNPHAENRG